METLADTLLTIQKERTRLQTRLGVPRRMMDDLSAEVRAGIYLDVDDREQVIAIYKNLQLTIYDLTDFVAQVDDNIAKFQRGLKEIKGLRYQEGKDALTRYMADDMRLLLRSMEQARYMFDELVGMSNRFQVQLSSRQQLMQSKVELSREDAMFRTIDEGDDELYDDARQVVIDAGKASTSYLQRKLRIGYARAARLIDMLEDRGVIGPAEGSHPREILEDADDDAA